MKAIWILLVAVATMHGADVTGSWKGNIEVADPSSGEKITTEVKAHFDQAAGRIRGNIGRAEDSQSEVIRNGKLDGKSFFFEVQPPEATQPMKFTLILISDDRIEGEMNGAIETGVISGKVILSRSK
jgi:hypothetical protein